MLISHLWVLEPLEYLIVLLYSAEAQYKYDTPKPFIFL